MLIKLKSLIYTLCGLFLVTAMLIWPSETYHGALYGLELWATILVPSLLPFFIITEILLNLGIVKILGEFLEPLMRPLFNLPGSTSFAVALGFSSGFPMGAVITRRLCEENLITVSEGERLVAFTNNSSPLFILAAVSVGMFENPALGLILAISHYSSNLLLGIILGVFSRKRVRLVKYNKHILSKFRTLLNTRKNIKPLGQMLGDSIKNGINNITLIGGFVLFFSVLVKLFTAAHILGNMTKCLNVLFKIFGLSPSLGSSFSVGFWEMTLGLRELSFLQVSFTQKAVIASIILGWSGLSIQAQVTSILAGSGIKPYLYYWGRIFQGIAAGIFAFLLSKTTLLRTSFDVIPAYSPLDNGNTFLSFLFNLKINFTFVFKSCCFIFLSLLILLFFLYYLKQLINCIK